MSDVKPTLTITPADTLAQLERAIKDGKLPKDESPSRSELEDLAKELHSVGDIKHKKDDYDKRLTALAEDFLPKLNVEDRGRFFGAIIDGDPGATKSDSWLQGSRLDKLVEDGRITSEQRHQVLEGFAAGFNQGGVDSENAARFLEMDGVSGEVVDKTPPGKDRIRKIENENTSGEVFSRFLHGLEGKSGTSDEFAEFVEKFAVDQIENGNAGSTKSDQDDRADRLGLLLNAADHAGKDQSVINRILHGVSNEKREQVIDDVSQGFSKVTTENAWLNREDTHLPDSYNKDPMELLIRAVGNDKDTLYAGGKQSYASDMAEYILDQSKNDPWSDNGFFDDQNIPKEGRQSALNEFVKHKSKEIFETNGLGESGIGADKTDNVTRNVRTMANLERLTGLSPTNDDAPAVLASLAAQSDGWAKDYITAAKSDSDNGKLQAEHKLTHLVASTEQAVLDGFADKAEDDKARKEEFANMVNLFLGFTPGGASLAGNLKSGLGKAFTRVFGEDSQASRILDKVADGFGSDIDSITSDQWRDELAEALTKSDYQDAYLEDFRKNANGFIQEQVLRGLEGDDYAGIRDEIVKEASQLLSDL